MDMPIEYDMADAATDSRLPGRKVSDLAGLRSLAKWQPWTRVRLVLRRFRSYDNLNDIYYHYLVNDYGSRDHYDDSAGNDNHSGVNNYNGGRKGYYDPSANYDHLINYDDSGSTASPATAASAANND